jgi:hypothetical protein
MINAKNKTLSEQNDLPDVSPGIDMFLQPVQLGIITKKQVSGYTQESIYWISTKAVRQAFTAQQLLLRPEGERAWKWYTIHLLVDTVLKPDDIIKLHGMRMRIMEKLDYKEYGFVEYHAIEDFSTKS